MVGILVAVLCVPFCHSCFPVSSMDKCVKPPVVPPCPQMSFDDDNVSELNNGDSAEEPDAMDKGVGNSCTDGPEEGVGHVAVP